MSASATAPAAAAGGMSTPTGDQVKCLGINECKGQGGCQSDKHACKSQNACKGQGGCQTDQHGCKTQNACKGQGGCMS